MTGLNRDILAEFKKITSLNAELYFSRATDFLSSSYNRITAYFSGKQSKVSQGDFNALTDLEAQTENFLSTIRLQKQKLKNLKWWLLIEHVESIDSRLNSLRKANKWSKSSLTDFGYHPSLQAVYTTKARQTLERIAQDVLKKVTPQDDWVDIAIANQLTEEDYTPAGGVPLQLSFPRINQGIAISAVVAVMIGKSIYGLDLNKKIQFDEDSEDLLVLSYDDTVQQAVEILANLRKYDNPDFPFLGLQSSVVIGNNRASLNFPVIGRQMAETFASDDSLKNFQLLSITVDQDNLNISFQCQTRLNETTDGMIIV